MRPSRNQRPGVDDSSPAGDAHSTGDLPATAERASKTTAAERAGLTQDQYLDAGDDVRAAAAQVERRAGMVAAAQEAVAGQEARLARARTEADNKAAVVGQAADALSAVAAETAAEQARAAFRAGESAADSAAELAAAGDRWLAEVARIWAEAGIASGRLARAEAAAQVARAMVTFLARRAEADAAALDAAEIALADARIDLLDRIAAAERAEDERRVAAWRLEAERLAAERAEAERAEAARRAGEERLAAERAEAERSESVRRADELRLAAERAEADKAEAGRRAEEQRLAAERAEADRAETVRRAEEERLAAERGAAERRIADLQAQRADAERRAGRSAEADWADGGRADAGMPAAGPAAASLERALPVPVLPEPMVPKPALPEPEPVLPPADVRPASGVSPEAVEAMTALLAPVSAARALARPAADAPWPQPRPAADAPWPQPRPAAAPEPRPVVRMPVGAAIRRILGGDLDALTRVAAQLGSDPAARHAWELRLTSLLEAILVRAVDAAAIAVPREQPFWNLFTTEQSRDIVAALSSLGYRFDGLGGWLDNRVPAQRELSMAVAHAGLDPMRVRRWPAGAEVAELLRDAHVLGGDYIAAIAPGLTVRELRLILGRDADALADVWEAWDRVRPLLLADRTSAQGAA